eukprot:2147032-Pyramimonas_sp.AAC.1
MPSMISLHFSRSRYSSTGIMHFCLLSMRNTTKTFLSYSGAREEEEERANLEESTTTPAMPCH